MTATVQKIDAAGAAEGGNVGIMVKDAVAAALLAFVNSLAVSLFALVPGTDPNPMHVPLAAE